ncbi:2TM domain-containing protein [Inhella crocodyli]|jgi:hypothetical protein|uniref:2TM domain-containing protein n=1 Tax=Inhella crocodyli TaxID=2499851 RepID=A0A437LHS3_9BURK|nr:2TM domain-containing protein [Inhella crocodyli]RVT84938.1 2TM domain-containing protein [Inhella crocodyli]
MTDLNAATPAQRADDIALRRQARKRVEMKMGFLVHLLVFVCVNGGLFLLSNLHDNARWHGLPFWGWGLGLAIHGVVTLASLQGADLRERLMAAELKALRERAAR